MNVLIVSGATREPIDDVRFLSNFSTGRTGAELAAELAARGHRVALLCGEGAATPPGPGEVERFGSTADLEARLGRRLAAGQCDLVVMAAAVSDYRPADANRGKIDSEIAELWLRLVRNPKLLPRIRSLSPRPLRVVGFKLTVGADSAARREAVAAQFSAGGVDCVVHNDLEEIRRSPVHPFWLYRGPDSEPAKCEGARALASALASWAAPGS